jgi:hypothetical protein
VPLGHEKLHVSHAKTLRIRKRYLQFHSALDSLNHYFDNWLLPREPEEAEMTRVILALQNILEYETELAIAGIASRSTDLRDRELQSRIEKGQASFQEKFKRLLQKGLISQAEYDVMDAIRAIRNEHAHNVDPYLGDASGKISLYDIMKAA